MVAASGFDFPLIVDDAVQLSGGVGMTAQDVQNARVALYLLLNEWSNRGYNTWRVRQDVDVAVPADTGFVTLQRNAPLNGVDDVLEARIQTAPGQFTPMARISPAEFARIASPGLPGLPTRHYIERTEPPVMRLYPRGRPGQVEIVRLAVVERPAAFSRTGAAVDAPSRWLNAVIHGIALALARRREPRDPERIIDLERETNKAVTDALGADRQRIPWRLR